MGAMKSIIANWRWIDLGQIVVAMNLQRKYAVQEISVCCARDLIYEATVAQYHPVWRNVSDLDSNQSLWIEE